MKKCSKCGELKPEDRYSVDRSKPSGRLPHCKECAYANVKRWRAKNKARDAESARKWRESNPDAYRAIWKRYAEKNREALNAAYLASVRANPEKRAAVAAKWVKANPHRARGYTATRRAAKRRATSVWTNLDKVREFYESADALGMLTGDWYHVDHIVPLTSPLVCGLHNEFNLQILTASQNAAKSNRHWPDMP
jgi:hypothetical protein